MGEKLTWNEMKNRYPDEWLLIIDFDLDDTGHLKSGIVKRHSKNKKDIYSGPVQTKSVAFRYTGESNFSGLDFFRRFKVEIDYSKGKIISTPV